MKKANKKNKELKIYLDNFKNELKEIFKDLPKLRVIKEYGTSKRENKNSFGFEVCISNKLDFICRKDNNHYYFSPSIYTMIREFNFTTEFSSKKELFKQLEKYCKIKKLEFLR